MTDLNELQQKQAEALFEQALAVEPDAREALLDSSDVDAVVRKEVRSLVAFHPAACARMETPIVAPHVIVEAIDELASDGAAEDAAPASVGPYRIIRKLGEGGMGTVYLAEQTEPLRRQVAAKLIKLGMDTHGVLRRFDAERQALALMNHPHIARVLDAGVASNGRPYFVMEYVEGSRLTDYCDRRRLDLAARLKLFRCVCQAIHHANQKGIIHRDIKPSNVLVCEVDGVAIPKVIDFGVAKATKQRLNEQTLHTEHGIMIGTPEYMSPEQAGTDVSDVDIRTDVYSLGVLLYELLVGVLPIMADPNRCPDPNALWRFVREERPPKPSTRLTALGAEGEKVAFNRGTNFAALRRSVRGDLEWIVMKCLEKERSRRYASVAELEADIQRYSRHEPVTAGPPTTTYLVSRFVRRHRALVAGIAVVFAVLAAGTASTAVFAIREARQRETAQAIVEFFNHEILASADPDREVNRAITLREVLDRAATKVGGQFAETPLVAAAIHETIGNAYLGLGVHDAAEQHLMNSVQLRLEGLGPSHPVTLEAQYKLGSVLLEQGRANEAERVFLEIQRYAHLGNEHQLSQRTLLAIGDVHDRRGELEHAEGVWSDVLAEQRRQRLGGDEVALTALNNLGLLLRSQGRYDEAEPMLREAYDTRSRTLGDNHPGTMLSGASLGWLYVQMEKYEKAEQLLNDAVQRAQKVFGEEHPRVLSYMSLLAGLYENTGRQEQALELNRLILDVRSRMLGGDHPDTLSALNTLAQQLVAIGRHSEAEILWIKTRESTERIYGPNHPTTLAAYHGLSGVLRRLGKPAEALEWSTQAIARAREHLPKGHWYLGAFLANHGQVLADLNRNEEAGDTLDEGVEVLKAALGVDHARTQKAIRTARDFCRQDGLADKAEKLEGLLMPELQSPVAGE